MSSNHDNTYDSGMPSNHDNTHYSGMSSNHNITCYSGMSSNHNNTYYSGMSSSGEAQSDNSEYRGWLLKWTNYIKGYRQRWFVLSDGLLSYYRSVT